MTRVFADTYYYLAIINQRDQGHAKAIEISSQSDLTVVTTEWILLEIGDAMSDPRQRPRFLALLDVICEDEQTAILPVSHTAFENGISLYSQLPDKAWSLTDCISFVVKQDEGLSEALTADRHFEQAGFVPLLV